MATLGYTWYSKDWRLNEKVFQMRLELRGFYREMIDFAYESDNNFSINRKYWCRMLGIKTSKLESLLNELLALKAMVKKGNSYSIPSVEPRIQLIRGGRKGGSESKKDKPPPKPDPKPDGKPDPMQIERETKIKSEREKEAHEIYLNIHKKIPEYLQEYITDKMGRERMVKLADELLNSDMFIDLLMRDINRTREIAEKEIKSFLKSIELGRQYFGNLNEVRNHFRKLMMMKYNPIK